MREPMQMVVGEGISTVFGRSIYLELNAPLQLLALALAMRAEINDLESGEIEKMTRMNDYMRAWESWRAKALRQLQPEQRR